MDTAQLLLIIVVVILTGLLLVLGIQVYFILLELRRTIIKTNKVLDDVELLAQSIANPISKFSAFTSSIKTGAVVATLFKLLPIFQGRKHHRGEEEEEEMEELSEDSENSVPQISR